MNDNNEKETPQLSYSELADLTHISQVELFGFCTCEDGPKVYEDCTQDGEYPEYPKNKTAKDYTLNTYANGFGVWHSEIFFTPPIGNTGEADRIADNAMRNAKRHIRQAIAERMSSKPRRLSYEVSSNSFEPGSGRLATLTITEK
jgi:hypothetical protein